jgi:xylulokinase
LAGVDVGTQSVKAGLYALSGECSARHAVALRLDHLPGEGIEQDPASFVAATASAVAACVEVSGCDPRAVAAIAIAGQMAGVLGIGRDGIAVTPYDSWLDARCSREVEEIDARLGDEVVARTGCPAMVAHAPKILWWKRNRPAVFARVERWVMPGAYVAGRLCGSTAADAFVDWTYLHFSGLSEAADGAWSPYLIDELDLDIRRLPRIVAPTSIVGALTREAAEACGLRAGTPVAAGLGDTAAGALGAGIVASGQVLDTAGTAAVLGVSTTSYRPDVETRTLVSMRGAIPGQWIALSYLSGGNLLRWLPQALAGSSDPSSLEALIDEASVAASPARVGHPLFIPHLGGRILPSAAGMRGAWLELAFTHDRGDLARAVLESVAYEYAGYLDRALALHPDPAPREVRVIGGGQGDALWNRIKAAVLGLPYARLARESFAPWGAALVAGAACGLVDDLAGAALAGTAVAERFEPDPELEALYAERLAAYRHALELFAPEAVHA